MKIKFLFFSLVLSLVFVTCQKDSPSKPANRLVLVYMVADNDLDYFAINNINEMERGFQSDFQGDLLVYIDRAANASPSHPYLMKISHDTTDLVVSKIIQTYSEQNSADAQTLKKVIEDARSCLGKNYTSMGLVLWSHGSAWLAPNTSLYTGRGTIVDSTTSKLKSFGYDTKIDSKSDTVCEMDIKEMANALSGYHFDFLLFDACFMASIEVAYQLRHTNTYFIASPVEILSTGFPYKYVVPLFFEKELNPKAIAQRYFDYYSNQKGILNSGSVCAIQSSELDNLALAVKNIGNKIGSSSLTIDTLQQFDRLKVGVLFDLKQFLNIVAPNSELKTNLETQWNKAVITELHTNYVLGSLSLKQSHGLSTFIPHKTSLNVYDYYKTLSWYTASGYDKIFATTY